VICSIAFFIKNLKILYDEFTKAIHDVDSFFAFDRFASDSFFFFLANARTAIAFLYRVP